VVLVISPAVLVSRSPATPLTVRPVRSTHRAGRRRVGCPPRPQSAVATPAGPAEGEGGGEGVCGESGGQGEAFTTTTALRRPAASTTMYLGTLRPLGGPGGRPRPARGRRRPARRSYIRSWCQTTRWPYARPRPPNGVNPSAAGLTVARQKGRALTRARRCRGCGDLGGGGGVNPALAQGP